MVTKTPKITPARCLAVLQEPVNTLLLEMVVAKELREHWDKIYNGFIREREYLDAHDGRVVTNHEHSFTLSDEDQAELEAKGQAARDAAGCTLPKGYCPALVAESRRRKAEQEVIKAAGQIFPEITHDSLFRNGDGVATYRKFIDLCIGLVVSAPGYRKPTIPRP